MYWKIADEILLNNFAYIPPPIVILRRMKKLLDWEMVEVKKKKEEEEGLFKPTSEGQIMLELPNFNLQELTYLKLCDQEGLLDLALVIVYFARHFARLFNPKKMEECKKQSDNKHTQNYLPLSAILGDIQLVMEIWGILLIENDGHLIASSLYGCSSNMLIHLKYLIKDTWVVYGLQETVLQRFENQ